MAFAVKIDIEECLKQLKALGPLAAEAERRTISDIKRRVQTPIREATAGKGGSAKGLYAITKAEVAAAESTTVHKAGKAKTATGVRGNLSSLTITFTGRKRADWPTKGKPRPKKVAGKAFSSKKKYAVLQETYAGHPEVVASRQNDTRVFIAKFGKHIRTLVAKRGRRIPFIHASTSVPQAIMNPKVVAVWQPKVHALVTKRLEHNMEQLSKKS